MSVKSICCAVIVLGLLPAVGHAQEALEKLPYNHPDLVVDLGTGLWPHPLPMDYDGDGDLDLVVVTADVPSNGTYFFENPDGSAFPVFKPGRKVAEGPRNTVISYPGGEPHVMTPGKIYPDFRQSGWDNPVDVPYTQELGDLKTRANQWKHVDYDGDEVLDLVIGLGVWSDYGWDNAFNEKGEWTRGPLHGYVYVARNEGTNAAPQYAEAEQVMAGEGPVDVYGAPSPNFADFDGDGDLDLLCGEFLDKFTYFQNTGSRTEPQYAAGMVISRDGAPMTMDLEMLQVVALDWDNDKDVDLIVGQEDGRVALVEHTGAVVDGVPQFNAPRFFQQEAEYVKVGALCTPVSYDWDADGDEDLIVGDTAGYINFVENLDGGNPPKWAAPVYLKAGGVTIRILAGPNGSIQGPAEAKWGYTVLNVADWNHDARPDIIINSIWGEVLWYENEGIATAPALKAAQQVTVEWEGATPKPEWFWWQPKGKQLVTQWRTTPLVIDLNSDELNDLVMLDTEGYLAFYERQRSGEEFLLLPPKRIFVDEAGNPLRLNEGRAGKSGRRKFAMTDWDGDGKLDLILNSINMDFLRNIAEAPGEYQFKNEGPVHPHKLAGHTTSPAIVDWDHNDIPDLLIGAEDGFLYHVKNPRQ